MGSNTVRDFFLTRQCPAMFFLVAFTLMSSGCENDPAEVARVTKQENAPLEHIKGLETLYSDSGIVRVKVTAPELKKTGTTQIITELPGGLHIAFYDQHLQVESELRAKYAIHYEYERKWEARNDVVVVNKKGEKLNTEKLIWDERKELLSSDQHVKITTSEEVIFGKGFEANQDFSKYKIQNVTGILTIKK